MTEISSGGLRVPTEDQPRQLRILGLVQLLSSIVTIVVGLIMGVAMFFFFPPFGIVLIVVGFVYASIGLAMAGSLPRREKSVRKSLLYINGIWVTVLAAQLMLAAAASGVLTGHFETFFPLLQYFGGGAAMPVLIILVLIDPKVKSSFV